MIHGLRAMLLLGAILALAAPAAAQTDTRALLDRIDRLERDLVTLQRQVYRGDPGTSMVITSPAAPPGRPAPGAVAGAPPPLPADLAGRLELRLGELETQLRRLTGQVEETQFDARRTAERLERLQADTDLRFKEIEGRGPAAATAAQPPAEAGERRQATAAPPSPNQPGVLGTLPQNEVRSAAPAQPPRGDAAVLKGGTPKEQYEYAFGLIRTDYDQAERALRAFIDKYPNDPLAGNAQYWLGETYYVRANYQQAAVTFLQAYQKYPKGAKAADSLLKLGLSLATLNQKKEGCAAFGRLLSEFPDAGENLRRRASVERQRLQCG